MEDLYSDLPYPHEGFSEDLRRCVAFHGHLCPGLTYGYLVSRRALEMLSLGRSGDEEVVAISENDTCAIDALQVMLGTTAGKGNLVVTDYGKNAFTILSRESRQAVRFSRRREYVYDGPEQQEFEALEAAFSQGRATDEQRRRQKWLKTLDLLAKPFEKVFETQSVPCPDLPYAPLAPSEPCSRCQEMTMATKLVDGPDGNRLCIPCAEATAPQGKDTP